MSNTELDEIIEELEKAPFIGYDAPLLSAPGFTYYFDESLNFKPLAYLRDKESQDVLKKYVNEHPEKRVDRFKLESFPAFVAYRDGLKNRDFNFRGQDLKESDFIHVKHPQFGLGNAKAFIYKDGIKAHYEITNTEAALFSAFTRAFPEKMFDDAGCTSSDPPGFTEYKAKYPSLKAPF